ncbi:MAG: dihydroxyacetone kinase subunit DhaK, partial [Jiangellaceae bacterium]
RADGPRPGKVGLISGGGSGHEPLHGGYVGFGMLDAAAPGEVYTSPVPDQILEATKKADGGAGVLHIVKNYTGDVLNFKMAAELADDDDIRVVAVVTNDDVAVEDSTFTAGRRGTGATVVVEKIAGAAAEEGKDLDAVAAIATEVNDRSRSFAITLTPGTVPAAGKPGFELADNEVELGVGIHGEPGRERGAMAPVHDLVTYALDAIHADRPVEGEVLVLLNGQGSTPLIELYGAFAEAAKWIESHGATISRSLVGDYITSLDSAGFSITVTSLTDELRRLWDAPVHTPALRWGR